MQNQVDIDQVIEEVKNWNLYTEKIERENEEMKRQIFLLEKNCELSSSGEAQARDEVDQLRKVIKVMQETIEKLGTAEEENHEGKKEIKKLKENEVHLQKLIQMKDEEVEGKMEAMKELNAKDIDNLKEEFEEEIKHLKTGHQASLDEKCEVIQKLRKQNDDLEREKQREVMMLRLEYDEKLQRLQKQTASVSQSSNSSSSSLKNEILRKKLQHVQSEAEKEINRLKNKILELEKCINKQQQIPKKRKLSFE